MVCILACMLSPALADIVPNVGFSDNMVLQRGQPVPVWGTAAGGEDVTVSFRNQERTAKAGVDGKWSVSIDPGDAGGPFELTLKGNNTLVLKNVMVGEVWLCSGQSNMEKSLESIGGPNLDSILTADYPNLRLINMRGSKLWKECAPSMAMYFPATAYYFGKELHQRLKVPVGVMVGAVGGTPIERWLDKASLAADPVLSKDTSAKGDLYASYIAPLAPYGIRGFVWYQGESNTSSALHPYYHSRFEALINGWRKVWGKGNLPFHFVQLANYRGSEPHIHYPEIREAQRLTLSVPNTAMAVTIDIGNNTDVHPYDKWDVGKRLVLPAMARIYGQAGLEYSGPLYGSGFTQGNTARLSFSHGGNGLLARGGGKITGFEMAGSDTAWLPAEVTVDKDTLILTAAGLDKPMKVRYAWRNTPTCNFVNGAGLPASPFKAEVSEEKPVALRGGSGLVEGFQLPVGRAVFDVRGRKFPGGDYTLRGSGGGERRKRSFAILQILKDYPDTNPR